MRSPKFITVECVCLCVTRVTTSSRRSVINNWHAFSKVKNARSAEKKNKSKTYIFKLGKYYPDFSSF